MADEKIIIEFDGDIKKLKAKLSDSQTQVSKLANGAKQLAKGAAIGFGALAAAAAGAVREASKFEDITTQFEVLTGSAQQATRVVKELQDFAANTPFQFEGIANAGQQLLGFGFSIEELTPKLQAIGDVAAASGEPIDSLSLIFGQVAAAGKLTGERLLQFQERAIPIGPAIAKTLGVAEKSVKDLVSRGEVDFKVFEKAFQSLSEEGGFAFEGLVKQSKTLSGLISTTKDNVSLFAAGIGQELLPVTKEIVTQLLGFIRALKDSDSFLSLIRGSISFTSKLVVKTAESFDILGLRIGAVLGTVSESINAALNLDFKKAIEIFKSNNNAFKEELIVKEQEYAEKIKAIDDALYAKQRENAELSKENLKADKDEEAEIKAQAVINEAELLKEIEAELAEQRFETEAERLEAINKLTQKKLKERFDAKRAVEKDDIKAAIKENQLRLKEEKRYGKTVADARAFFRSKDYQAAQAGLDALISLGQTGNKKLLAISKAASIAKAIINTAEGVTKALTLGFPLGTIAATAIGAAGAAQIATISGVKFAKGGLAEGGIMGKDSIPAVLQSGELVNPRQNFEEVIGSVRAKREADKLLEQGLATGQSVDVELSFRDDVGEFIEAKIIERRATGVGVV